jgi:F0F1-type ATP synthase membrane subunit b/b'
MIIMNLFIGVIMNSMEESQRELEQRIHDSGAGQRTSEAMFRNIEEKLDELKKEINSLRNQLN